VKSTVVKRGARLEEREVQYAAADVKRRFSVTSKYQHMHEVLNVDEIKN
jgi:hypothetical protein